MIPENVKKTLEKQHYKIVGDHSAVQICRWTKKSIKNEGVCYKEKFYGIKSHLCCQMSPAVMWCQNKCIHCWRAIELNLGDKIKKEDSPTEIIEGCILAQRKLLEGFKILPETRHKTLSKANMKKWEEAQDPMQFAISLSGEPTIYSKIGELIKELRKMGKTSFLVTNGLMPKKLEELYKKNQLPTQLYVSVNTSNEDLFKKFHNSSERNAWKKLNQTLKLFPKLKKKTRPRRNTEAQPGPSEHRGTRTVFRMNLIRDLNMKDEHIKEFAELIKISKPMFIEVKGFMSVGFARQRLGYERMPTHEEIKKFSKRIIKELKNIGEKDYKILDEQERSCVLVIGKDKKELKIKKEEI